MVKVVEIKDKFLQIRCTQELKDRLYDATTVELTMSDIVNIAIEDYLEKHKDEQDA